MKHYKLISSPANNQFKQLKKLLQSAKSRRTYQQTLLDGPHLLTSLAQSEQSPREIFIKEGAETTHAEIKHCLDLFPDIPVTQIKPALFDTISPVDTPTGVIALYDIPTYHVDEYQFGILLEQVQDPGNLGSILRTVCAAGAQAVFLSKNCADIWSPKSLRAGMGAHFQLKIYENADLFKHAQQFPSVVATTLSAKQSLFDTNLTGKLAFVFGNEGSGISDELLKLATQQVTIPMLGQTESLNVAAATAVCSFERVRQLKAMNHA